MKLLFSISVLIITIVLYSNALTLRRRESIDSDNWNIVSESTDNYQLSYNTISNKVDFLQFRVDREDESRILNDLFINITSVKLSRLSIFFNNMHPANSTTDKRAGYCPIWFQSCGSDTPYFSLGSNNSYVSNLTITVTVREEINLCDF